MTAHAEGSAEGRRLRALIADDEPLARKLLAEMLEDHPDIEIAALVPNGTAALEFLDAYRVDLLFLDIEMPGLNGMALAEALGERLPATIFVTAYDQYAVAAFEVRAVDYLLKPFDAERLGRALERVRLQISRPSADHSSRILSLLEDLHRRDHYSDHIVIRVGERSLFEPAESVEWIEANGKYVNLHVGAHTHTVRETLAGISEGLDPRQFVRVSRSAIVNVGKVREIQPWFRGEYILIMRSGQRIPTTRAFRDNVTRLLSRRS